MTGTNITDIHRADFDALMAEPYENFALFSCFVNGSPAASIVAVHWEGGTCVFTPLFVNVTDDMVLTDHEGRAPKLTKPSDAD